MRGQRRYREVVGTGGAVGDAGAPRSRPRVPPAPMPRVSSPADASSAPSRISALQSPTNSVRGSVDQRLVEVLDGGCGAERGRGLERVEARVGSGRWCGPPRRWRRRPPRSHARAGPGRSPCAAAPRTCRRRRRRGVEDVDADDVTVDRTDGDATRPSAPGRSGSHTRTRTWVACSWASLTEPMLRPKMTRCFAPVKTRHARRLAADDEGPMTRATERLGVFRGTFDPVHAGHVVVATETAAQLGLDRVLLVVAGDPWQKRGRVIASAADRLALVGNRGRRARRDRGLRGRDRAERAVGHRRHARGPGRRPGRELFLVLGADAVANMGYLASPRRDPSPRHRRGGRAGGGRPLEPPGAGWRVERVAIPRLDISSTDLRQRLGEGTPDRRPGATRCRAPDPRAGALHWREMTTP